MISLHLLADGADQARLDRAILYLKRVKARSVNIGGGSQIDRAMTLVERVRAEIPGIRVFWRQLEDTGIHAQMQPFEWYASRVSPRLEWLKKNQCIFVLDNESSGDNSQIQRYAAWEADVLKRLHTVGLFGAACRFATGNIREDQYALLKPIFDVMLPGDYISPNEYSNAPGKSSGGHLERYMNIWRAAGRNLPTTIGEAGIAADYDPGKGYRAVPGLTGRVYAEQMISEEIWYGGGSIDRFLYCIGGHGWENFQIGDDVLETLEGYYAKLSPPVVVSPPPVPVPPPVITPPPPPAAPFVATTRAMLLAEIATMDAILSECDAQVAAIEAGMKRLTTSLAAFRAYRNSKQQTADALKPAA